MPTLQLIITDAGRQAIVDATNTGTLPVVLDEIALGTGKWEPDATAIALDAELKRITTVGGLAVADDTIHITCTDDSTDAYALGEFGIYTDGGVLFAIYSGLAGITDKFADALLLLAADVVLTSVPPGSVTVNGVGFSNPPATESLAGIAEITTQAESDAGIDDARIVTPKKAKASAAAYPYTVDQALAAPANTGAIAQLLSWIAGRIMAITGKSDWKTAPATTLEATKSHIDSTVPHSATSAATAERLMMRDSYGDTSVRLVRSTHQTQTWEPADTVQILIRNNETTDNYLRPLAFAQAQAWLGGIPAGTIMLFGQSAAPTGWTKKTDYDNKALRVVSGTAGTGGSVAFTTAFANNRAVTSVTAGGSVGVHTLNVDEIPSHSHVQTINGTDSDSHPSSGNYSSGSLYAATAHNSNASTQGAGLTGAHSHPFTGISHNHTLDMSVQYVDVIRAQKN